MCIQADSNFDKFEEISYLIRKALTFELFIKTFETLQICLSLKTLGAVFPQLPVNYILKVIVLQS